MASEYGKYGADPNAFYSTPAGAIIVAKGGSDSTGTGTVANPYGTVKYAVSQVPAGGTVAIRGGVYHEGARYPQILVNDSIFLPAGQPNVTIQNYGGEEVWIDGSQVVGGWAPYDTNKFRAPFSISLDRTPTQVRGQDSSSYGSYLLAEFPIAHWPEMLFIDGVQQTQVQTLAEVGPGKFFVEGTYPNATGENRLRFQSSAYVMGDDPAGKEIRIASLSRALTCAADNLTVRGIGFRRYAAALPDIGAVYANDKPGITFENVSFMDMSDLALNITNPGWVIRNCTFLRNGRQAINAGNRADNGLLEWSYFENTNIRRFNYGPIGGNIKTGMQWNSTVRWNRMVDTYGHSVWFDECCYESRIYGNWMSNTYGAGIVYEISARAYIVDNILVDNGINSTDVAARKPRDGEAIKILSSANCHVWHNTVINPEISIAFSEGYRKPLNDDGVSWRSTSEWGAVFGQDKGRTDAFYQAAGFADVWDFYQREMNWDSSGVSFANNVFAGAFGYNDVYSTFLRFYIERGDKGAAEMTGQLSLPNVYARVDGVKPKRFANSAKASTTGGVSETVVYFGIDSLGHEGSPSWRDTMNDRESVLTTQDVVASRRDTLLDRSGVLAAAPVAVPPPEVQSILNISKFTTARVGAGDPLVPGATYQTFRDIRIGDELAVAMFIGDTQAWPTV